MIHHHITHAYHTLKRGAIFFLFFFFFLCGFFTAQNRASKNTQESTQVKEQCAVQVQQVRAAATKTNDADLKLYVEKEKVLEKVVESPLYFTSSKKILSPNQFEITIMLKGGSSMRADAADLVLSYSDNLTISEIRSGETFDLYPRKLIESDRISITGIASLAGASLKLGEPNKIFVSLIVEKKGDSKQIGTISLDAQSTNVYLQGKSVLNTEIPFAQIDL